MSIYRLSNLLSPRSAALVGASPRPESVGLAVLKNIRAAGFEGAFGIVNPNHAEVGGMATVNSIAELSFVPELIIVTAPPAEVPGIITEAGSRGVAGAVIITAGLGHGPGSFAEAANQAARLHGMRLIGPNCLGIMIPAVRLNASFAAGMPRAGSLALISQSGAIAAGMETWGNREGVGFSGIVSIGDQLDVDVADLLDYFALDPRTETILLYIEAIKDARKFMSSARAAARVKPVVVVKSGRMAQGARAAATHTGALAGSDEVYDAAFRRAGILRVFDLRELFDCAGTLGRVKAPRGKRLAILTNGGGIGVLAVDRLVELGGIPATISSCLGHQLDAVLPTTWSRANPVDIVGDADAARYAVSLEKLLADPDNDAVIVLNVETAISAATEIATTVARVVCADRGRCAESKPVLAVWIGADGNVTKTFNDASIPYYPTEDDAVRGFMYLVHHREALEELTLTPPSLPAQFTPDVVAARRIIATAVAEGRRWLDPIEVKGLFEAYQISMVPTLAAADADQAVALASDFFAQGLKVVLKILSRDITHKSDVGGVVLNLADADSVRIAATDIWTRAKEKRPDAKLSGVIVQPMISRANARELILGIADDPTFGPVIVFGHGGTAVEIINDKALALPPLDLRLAHDLVERTRVSRLLCAYRDVPAANRDEVVFTLVKLAQLAADLPQVHEVDINPLLADESGVLAVDARVAVGAAARKFAGPGNARFAVRPYPSDWQRHILLRDGSKIFARPIQPSDEALLREFLSKVRREDLRLRFFSAVSEFTHAVVARMTQLDYARAMAFVAFDYSGKDIIGLIHLHSDSIYENGEYAILLRSDLKGQGLGWALMNLMIEYAKFEGLKHISGQVLNENVGMLQMCRELGFQLHTDVQDAEICEVSLALNGIDRRSAETP
jgi:acetyltransferase